MQTRFLQPTIDFDSLSAPSTSTSPSTASLRPPIIMLAGDVSLDASNFVRSRQVSSADDSDTASVDTEPTDSTSCLDALLTLAATVVPRTSNNGCSDTEIGEVKRKRKRSSHLQCSSSISESVGQIVLATHVAAVDTCRRAVVLPQAMDLRLSIHGSTSRGFGTSVQNLAKPGVLHDILSAFIDAEITGATYSSLGALKHELCAARQECIHEVKILHMEEMVQKVVKEADDVCLTICDALRREEEDADNHAAQILSGLGVLTRCWPQSECLACTQ